MRCIDADALAAELDEMREAKADNYHYEAAAAIVQCIESVDEATTIEPERPKAIWHYHNDEHGVWWGCGNCGKILRRPPNDKLYCSRCGAEMTREA